MVSWWPTFTSGIRSSRHEDGPKSYDEAFYVRLDALSQRAEERQAAPAKAGWHLQHHCCSVCAGQSIVIKNLYWGMKPAGGVPCKSLSRSPT
jgi:hypothetical protein